MTDNEIVPTEPLSRREVWLRIALAVARDGMAEPAEISFNPGSPDILYMYFDTDADADTWGRWCDAAPASMGFHRYSSHRDFGGKWGYSWNICSNAKYNDAEQVLAAEVVTALTEVTA